MVQFHPSSPNPLPRGQAVRHHTLNVTFASSNLAEATTFLNYSLYHNNYGGIAKWPNAADCKSVPSGSMVRIHLSPPLLLPRSQAVRHHTLTVAFASSNLAEATINDPLAQSVEHLTFNQRVSGSNPERVTTLDN